MLIYDLHCHLLPGLDDGAFSTDESLQMAEMAADASSGCIVCTPHVFSEKPSSARDLIQLYRQVYDLIRENEIPIRLSLGQEIFLGQNIKQTADMLEKGILLTINRTLYPLVEVHPEESEETVFMKLSVLISRGFMPILAHPERYAFAWENPAFLVRLKKAGVLLQVNKDSITGGFGSTIRKTAEYMLSMYMADFVASDAHSPTRRTPPLLQTYEYISNTFSEEYADLLLHTNPLHVLRNETVEQY